MRMRSQRRPQIKAEGREDDLTRPVSLGFGLDFSRAPIHPLTAGIQTELAVNKLGDGNEQEAERVADQAMAAHHQEAAKQLEQDMDELLVSIRGAGERTVQD